MGYRWPGQKHGSRESVAYGNNVHSSTNCCMKRQTGPTKLFVGPVTLRLGNQPEEEAAIHVLPGLPSSVARSRVKSAFVTGLILLFTAMCPIPFAGAADPYAADDEMSPPELNYYVRERNQRAAAEQQEQFRKRVPVRDAVGDDVFAAYARKQKGMNQSRANPLPALSNKTILTIVFAFVASILVVRKLAPELFVAINKKFNPWMQTAATVANLSAKVRAEDQAFSQFVAAFRMGPATAEGAGPAEAAAGGRGLLMEFHANAPMALAKLQQAIHEIGLETKTVVRQRLLAELHHQLHGLKGEAGLPELLPAWQLASALEGLVKQLCDKASDVTLSTLRTISAGVDLLKELCVPGLQTDLFSNPPIRLLTVDDDLISRKAVAFALKKALNAPDLAESGEAALALAMEQAYDVVFLDVQMPGMDGYETCTRIHSTALNNSTPVVFVTCLNDFEVRAKSAVCGGNDLIGKPFLTFEITVKALTLAFQGRLTKRAQLTPATEVEGARSTESSRAKTTLHSYQDLLADTHNVVAREMPGSGTQPSGNDLTTKTGGPVETTSRPQPHFTPPCRATSTATSAPPAELSSKELLQAFLVRASTNLAPMRDLIQTLFRVTDENLRLEMLSDFFLRFNALAPQNAGTEEHPALRLCIALEGLLTKMVANSKHCTSSTLLTAATAVDLLIELCDPAVRPNLMSEPPIHMLVVDDDPVARRAVTGALQMAFEKPESVDSGEAALAQAREKAFDAVFMDVEMPGMDGFAACLKIHESELNRTTPVVFVTGHSDFKARSQSSISGGSDLIAKPFLPAEIKVKALTFVMRGRLHKDKSGHHRKLQTGEAAPKPEELVPA